MFAMWTTRLVNFEDINEGVDKWISAFYKIHM